MLINSISNSPRIFNGYSNVNITTPLKTSPSKVNNSLSSDTVTFTGNNSTKVVNEAVSLVFEKLNTTKQAGVFRKYLGVNKDNINVLIQETSLGNEAVLAFTNGNFGNNTYALYEIRRTPNNPSTIISLENDKIKNDVNTAKMIKNILSNMKK